MKAGWKKKSLGDLCEVVGGGTPPKDNLAYYSGDIPWATVRDMRQEVITETECQITRAAVQSSATNVIPTGNVVIATRVGLGKVCLLGQDTAINQDLRGIIPRDHNALSVRFLFWWLKSIADIIIAEGTGATVQGVKLPFVKSLQVPIPPLTEQHRIVTILDEAFDGIVTAKANAEKNLQNARALFESHLQSVFTARGEGWVEKRIEEWCASIMDCVNKTARVVEGPTPFKMIRTTNVRNGRVDVSTVRFVTEEIYKVWTRRQIPQKGDVILTREAPMGEVGMLVTDDKVFLGQRLVSYRANPNILDNHFLLLALQSGDLQGQIHAKASGSTVQHMRVPDTKSLLLAAPPLQLQREIVAKLEYLREETQRLESLYQQKLTALDGLKKSLLHQAFSEKL
ncbi:MAG: restriction endonuclease subunit S [Nitrosospira sp.]